MIPDPDIIFARVAKAKFFSKMNLSKGLWQIKVNPADRPKLACATPVGTFQWYVMPCGTQNSAAGSTRMMRKLLAPLHDKPVLNFMDDLIIATESFEEHIELLGEVLSRLRPRSETKQMLY